MLDYEMAEFLLNQKCDYLVWQLGETRPQEIIIIGLLIIAIGIGVANLIAIKKKDRS